jgi:predicted phage terminase large subunit-like protein
MVTSPRAMTPGGFAHRVSDGRWVCPPHLDLLNRVLCRVMAGHVKRLLVCMPPRHGKSELISKYFPALYLGTFPDQRVILTSYEADFARTWGGKVRDVLSRHGPEYFGFGLSGNSTAADRWDIDGHAGGMVTAGVGGPITGKGADLFILDDPVKNAEEANSETIRDKQWDWFGSTAYTRLEPGAAVIVFHTRWHEADIAGRLISRSLSGDGEHWDVVTLPAVAEEGDALGRSPGEALWPDRYDVAALAAIRKAVGEYWWSALYQQRPVPLGGLIFKPTWFSTVDARPAHAQWVRYWDKAGTQDGGAYTAGVLMGRAPDGVFYVADVVRGQWSAGEREMRIRATAERDGKQVAVWVEQEPGSGGKESAQNTVINLAGWDVHAEPVTGDKVTRARPFAAQAEVGNCRVVRDTPERPWVTTFLDELALFDKGRYKDQVDAASGAFNKLALIARPGPAAVAGHRPTLATAMPTVRAGYASYRHGVR